jgi:hypothetical protein
MLKETGTDWCEIRLIRKFYMDQSVKSMTGPKGDKKCEDGKKLNQDFICLRFCSTDTSSPLLAKLLKGLETSE